MSPYPDFQVPKSKSCCPSWRVAGFAPALTAAGTQQCALYFIPSRIEPTMPPTTPPCTASLVLRGHVLHELVRQFGNGSVCSQIPPAR